MANKQRLLEVMGKVNPDFLNENVNVELDPQLKKDLGYKDYTVGQTANGDILLTHNDVSAQINPTTGEVEFGGDATVDMFPEDFEETVAMVLKSVN